ncbi:IS4 family transposase [Ramlibacter alkalitolerans]|nr:IS4 family transposase [Ramlibacter alkalitolerans]
MHRLSRFAQLMKGLPRDSFQKLVDLHAGDRYVKKFGCWQQLLAMVYGQLAGVSSLRELEAGFNQHRNHHYHLGAVEVHRSTLSNANDGRNPMVFEEAARLLIALSAQAVSRKERKELLYLIDSTTIALYGRGSQWTEATKTRTRGLKVHVQFESGSQLPVHFNITSANVNDETEGSKIAAQAGATYVYDKGYCNYAWWERIAAAGARFVTRLKKNAAIELVSVRQVPSQAVSIAGDSVIQLANKSNRGGHKNRCRRQLRRIEVARPNDDNLVLVSNDLDASAQEIADLYRQRWEIELFFKWIKQHLKVKKFLGESENAVRIQLLTALITYLLVSLQKVREGFPGTLWNFLTELRTGLFLRDQEESCRWRRCRHRQADFDALQPGLFG